MENRGWIVVVAMMLAFVLAGCGSGDANEGENDPGDDGVTDDVGPDDVAPSCGDGTCEMGEGCESCADDCACTTEYTTCRNDACVDWDTINPLLKKLPGHWVRIEPLNSNTNADVTVDPSDPDCHDGLVAGNYDPDRYGNPNEPGDACVLGFQPCSAFVLHGSSFQGIFPNSTYSCQGQVLDNGERMEYVWSAGGDTRNVYVKQ